ncbi:MAG: hypothetical protein GYB67_04835, partial [Chloroflexi bacterium]|nr:hypothetical protein [Chloroflexota bacterium]
MINLYDILEAASGQLFGEPGQQLFSDFCFDSRFAQEAQLFVALRSDQGDGHQYIYEAVQRGATGVLCMRPPNFDTSGLSVLLVRDTEAALMSWAQYILNKLDTTVIGVAGTGDKSITVEAINHVLATQYPTLQSSGHLDGRLKLPQT